MFRLFFAPPVLSYAHDADASALAHLHALTFPRPWDNAAFLAMLQDPRYVIHKIDIKSLFRKKIAGFCVVRFAAAEAEIITLAVAPRFQGRGLGRKLLGRALNDALRRGIHDMFLEVEENNSAALALYRQFDFIQVGERKGYYPQSQKPAATALVMRRPLTGRELAL